MPFAGHTETVLLSTMPKLCPQPVPTVNPPVNVPERFTVVKRADDDIFRVCIGSAKGPTELPSVPTLFVGTSIEDITNQIRKQWPAVTGCRRLRRSRASPSKTWLLLPRFA
eukprot:m.484646 g.484646  ORF g.484646 m.484646 type:complete len:111 (-) comp69767_c0_seq1:137-469(-)